MFNLISPESYCILSYVFAFAITSCIDSYIMEEYQDCLQRARRLAVACEATLAGSDSAMSVVTMEDLLIYTRWLICMLHSVKAFHAFIRVSKSL